MSSISLSLVVIYSRTNLCDRIHVRKETCIQVNHKNDNNKGRYHFRVLMIQLKEILKTTPNKSETNDSYESKTLHNSGRSREKEEV